LLAFLSPRGCLRRQINPSTMKLIQDAKRVVRSGLVGLGPSLISVTIPAQA
jgi:hypothetical protein